MLLRRLVADGRLPAGALPAKVRRAARLDEGRISPLRIEIGGGPHPTPGYVHVDADRSAAHLEHLAPAWQLPFGDGEVDEILAVHVLEHIPPGSVVTTLREWARVLGPNGLLQVHVPNGRAIAEAYLTGDREVKWGAISAIYGQPSDLGYDRPYDRTGRPPWSEHQVLYDLELLTEALQRSGFGDIHDASAVVTDRHTEGWAHLIPALSLVVRARPRR